MELTWRPVFEGPAPPASTYLPSRPAPWSDVAAGLWTPHAVPDVDRFRGQLSRKPDDYAALCGYERAWFGEVVPRIQKKPWCDERRPLAFAWRHFDKTVWVRCYRFESVMLARLRLAHELRQTFARAPLHQDNARFFLRAALAADYAARIAREWMNLPDDDGPLALAGGGERASAAARDVALAACHACVAAAMACEETAQERAERWAAILKVAGEDDHIGCPTVRWLGALLRAEAWRAEAEARAERGEYARAAALQEHALANAEMLGAPADRIAALSARLAVFRSARDTLSAAVQKAPAPIEPVDLPYISLGTKYPPSPDAELYAAVVGA